jgi:hypothetical protein
MITQEQFKILLPLATAWAEEQEGVILRDGIPLNKLQMTDAQILGINQPEKVRLLNVAVIPLPDDPLLKAAAQSNWPNFEVWDFCTFGLLGGQGVDSARIGSHFTV